MGFQLNGSSDGMMLDGLPAFAGTNQNPQPAAQGIWIGSTANNGSLVGIVLDDGTYYVMYSLPGSSLIDGYVQGTGTSSNGSFTSSNARDFNFRGTGVLSASISATYIEKQSFTGNLNYANNTIISFSAMYDSHYDATPLLSDLVGTFVGQVAGTTDAENGTFSISANGALSGIGVFGCTATGSIMPREHGNIFNVSVTFGGPPCQNQNQAFTGIAYYDASEKRIYLAAPNALRTDASFLSASSVR